MKQNCDAQRVENIGACIYKKPDKKLLKSSHQNLEYITVKLMDVPKPDHSFEEPLQWRGFF